MAKTTRNMAMAVMAAAILAGPRVSAAADATVPEAEMHNRHVRSSNPALLDVIHQASERSATFRSLVETIEASDTIVFVEQGRCRQGVRACFVSVVGSKSNRFMRVVIDTRKADWDWNMMGSIGHELRHTIEVIDSPGVRDNASKYFFYRVN